VDTLVSRPIAAVRAFAAALLPEVLRVAREALATGDAHPMLFAFDPLDPLAMALTEYAPQQKRLAELRIGSSHVFALRFVDGYVLVRAPAHHGPRGVLDIIAGQLRSSQHRPDHHAVLVVACGAVLKYDLLRRGAALVPNFGVTSERSTLGIS
jgi:hypothetical protein